MRWQLQWNPDHKPHSVELLRREGDIFIFLVDGKEVSLKLIDHYPFSITTNEISLSLESWTSERWRGIANDQIFDIQNISSATSSSTQNLEIKSQMPGRILRLLVKPGDTVVKGAPLIVIEAMKMENEVRAQSDCVVKNILVKEGQSIESNTLMIELQ